MEWIEENHLVIVTLDVDRFKKAVGSFKTNRLVYHPFTTELKCRDPKKIDKYCVADVDWVEERFPVLTKVVGLKEVKPYVPGGKYPANAELFYYLDANQAKWAAHDELIRCIHEFYPNLDKNVAKMIGNYVLKIKNWPSPKRQEFAGNYKLDKLKSRLKQIEGKIEVLTPRESGLRRQLDEVEKDLNETKKDQKRLKKLVQILEK